MPLSSMTNLGFAASFFSNSLRPRLQNASTSSERGAKSHVHITAPRMTLSKRELRKQIISSDQYNRKGFQETREAAEGVITKEFTSELFKELLDNANTVVRGDVTLRLAKAYGFCWGVERAVAMAYETRRRYPTERIWITNEIIHNPVVNQRMRDMGIYILELEGMKKDLSGIGEGDVVILPAFGASLEELQHLHSLKCRIVDTTCPWVSKVWTTLDKHRQANCTSIIHGKWKHEETVATASFAEKYLIVLNMDEAKYVSSYILHGGDKAEFSNKFKNAMSTDFDPDTDLEAVGIANQTTMLKSETTAIGKLFERTMMQKYGPAELNKRFVAYDTICDATQERQDAMYELLADKDNLDLMLVVGGFNSSNTSHLQEIAEHAGIPSYWVDRPERVGPDNRIYSRTSQGEEKVIENWLPSGPITIGLTSGASTPDKVVEDVMERVFMISKLGRLSVA